MAKIFRPLSGNVVERVKSDLMEYGARGNENAITVTTYKAGRPSEERTCRATVLAISLCVCVCVCVCVRVPPPPTLSHSFSLFLPPRSLSLSLLSVQMTGKDFTSLDPRKSPAEKHLANGVVDVMMEVFSRQDALLSKRRREKHTSTADHEVKE